MNTPEVHVTRSTLKSFSQSLFRLVNLARECGIEQFMPAALSVVGAEIGFRSAWWGWVCEPASDQTPPRVHLSGCKGLPDCFAQDWAAVASDDRFARASLQAPGTVLRFSADPTITPHEPVGRFAQRHDLFHSMALSAPESASGMMFFIVAYRGISDPAFSEDDATLFGEFAQHLLQLTQHNLREVMALASESHAAGLGLIGSQGSPLFLGSDLCRQIGQQWPDWDGCTLPNELQAQLTEAPCAMPLGAETIEIRPHGGRFLIRMSAERSSALLAPRQRRVAVLYATGRSYKEIAQILSLSPATVRTYLRDCYARLGVSNRIALSGALTHAMTRARAPEEMKTVVPRETDPLRCP